MRINECIALSTPKVLLVPYRNHHVPTYHSWMQDPAIQTATASEPLTLPEEYSMQKSWRSDGDKLTFILCLPLTQDPLENEKVVSATEHDSAERMLGDVNLFLIPDDDDDEMDKGTKSVVGELEIMVAKIEARRRGYGRAALSAFMAYIHRCMDDILAEYASAFHNSNGEIRHGRERKVEFSYFRVKIGKENSGSIALFSSLGFKKLTDEANYFGEIEMRRNIDWIGDHEEEKVVELRYV